MANGLPSYEDAIYQCFKESLWISYFQTTNTIYFLSDLFGTLIAIIIYVCLHHTDSITMTFPNMTQYCASNDFKMEMNPDLDYNFTPMYLLFTVLLPIGIIILKAYIMKYSWKKAAKKLIWEIWVIIGGILSLLVIVEIFKYGFHVPVPYFFNDPDMYGLYCNSSQPAKLNSEALKLLDMDLHKSFPSSRTALYGFCTAFMYLYFDHVNYQLGPRYWQQLVLVAMAGGGVILIKDNILNNQSYICDNIVGAVLGVVQGFITIRNIFGAFFHQHMVMTTKTSPYRAEPARPAMPPSLVLRNTSEVNDDSSSEEIVHHRPRLPSPVPAESEIIPMQTFSSNA